MSQQVASALADMRSADPDLADQAEAAWQVLDGTSDASRVTQWRVQRFCWFELPRAFIADPEAQLRVACAVGELLARIGLSRYADVARGETTHRVLQALADGDTTVPARLMRDSGIEPPDTDQLSWSIVGGPAEGAAYQLVADSLEMAVQLGEYTPGRPCWRRRQREVTERVLSTPRPDLDNATPYQRLVDERIDAWVSGAGSHTREALLAPFAGQFAEPVPVPDDKVVGATLGLVGRFLRFVGDGAPLTPSGYLKPEAVARCADEVGLADQLYGRSRRESDQPPVLLLRAALQRMGLVRRRADRLVLAPAGRATAVADPGELWHSVAACLVPLPAFTSAASAHVTVVVWDVVLASLATGPKHMELDLMPVSRRVLQESGWRVRSGDPVDDDVAYGLIVEVYRDLVWLGLVERSAGPVVPAAGAVQLFLAALRHRVLHSRTLAVARLGWP